VYFAICGLATVLLGAAKGPLLVAAVILQPVCTVLFFPAGFTLLAKMFNPRERNAALAFLGPTNAVFGVGLMPWVLGILGEQGEFATGFIFQGAGCLLLLLLVPLLPGEENPNR